MTRATLHRGAPQFQVVVLAILGEKVGNVLILLEGGGRSQIVAVFFLELGLDSSIAKEVQMERELADLQALAAERGDHCLNPNGAVDTFVMPAVTSPALYYRAVDLYGDPAASTKVVDQASFDAARANLVMPGCK